MFKQIPGARVTAAVMALTLVAIVSASNAIADGRRSVDDSVTSLLASTSDDQRPALLDLQVTDAEFRAAIVSTVACIGELGAVVDEYHYSTEFNRVGFTVHSSDESVDPEIALEDCSHRFLDDLVTARRMAAADSKPEQAASWAAGVSQCMRTSGFGEVSGGTPAAVVGAIDRDDRVSAQALSFCKAEVEGLVVVEP